VEQPFKQVDISGYLARPSVPELELLRLFGRDPALTIFDVGCCEGEDTVRYARRFPKASVYAFEPLPENQRLAASNFSKYSLKNAELVPCALSDQAGEAVFHVSSGRPREEFAGKDWNYGNKSSSLLPPAGDEPMHGWIEFKQRITVKTETLDGFSASRGIRRVDFVHMDVQGAEQLVLSGASGMLPRVAAVWLEVSARALYKGQALRHQIGAFMRAHGFILALEVLNEVEGDQLYVNRRFARTWPYLASRRIESLVRRARLRAGRWLSPTRKPTPDP
jgi:FkbM family methyltransferase